MYLCTHEAEFSHSCANQWLWQDNHCQRVDGIIDGQGLSGTALQVRTRLHRYEVS